jgi:hypothetical protein
MIITILGDSPFIYLFIYFLVQTHISKLQYYVS